MRLLARLLVLVPKSLRPKRKPHWKKKLAVSILSWVVVFGVLTSAMVIQYWRGRYDERQVWEPKWEMERDVYRLMPYGQDD